MTRVLPLDASPEEIFEGARPGSWFYGRRWGGCWWRRRRCCLDAAGYVERQWQGNDTYLFIDGRRLTAHSFPDLQMSRVSWTYSVSVSLHGCARESASVPRSDKEPAAGRSRQRFSDAGFLLSHCCDLGTPLACSFSDGLSTPAPLWFAAAPFEESPPPPPFPPRLKRPPKGSVCPW